ncbi:MAG TPA: DedA family protein, partial [Solirubrobacterales bacterium]|nr:DedA family protein [Solirubrobacterales bacterium]
MNLPGTEKQRKWASRVAIVVAIGIAYYLFTQVLDLESLLEKVAHALGAWTYALVGFFAFAETGAFIGLVAPGETVMLLGGAVAGQGAINLYVTIALAWTMACAGDVTSFFLGRRLGREFLLKHGPRFGFSHERLHQVEDFFSRHGGKTIF